MTKFGLLGAAAVIIASTLVGPAMAQQAMDNSGRSGRPNAHSRHSGHAMRSASMDRRRNAYWNNGADEADGNWNDRNASWNNGWQEGWNDNGWNRRDQGFWPGEVAADVAGDAIGTAGAIATAPFRAADAYGYYDNGPRMGYDDSYYARNGFVCHPGSWIKGEDGRRHLCQ